MECLCLKGCCLLSGQGDRRVGSSHGTGLSPAAENDCSPEEGDRAGAQSGPAALGAVKRGEGWVRVQTVVSFHCLLFLRHPSAPHFPLLVRSAEMAGAQPFLRPAKFPHPAAQARLSSVSKALHTNCPLYPWGFLLDLAGNFVRTARTLRPSLLEQAPG